MSWLLCICLICFGFGWEKAEATETPPVYVISDFVATLKSTPQAIAETVTQAQRLDPVVILEDGKWCLVSLPRQHNYQGYIEKKSLIAWQAPAGKPYVAAVGVVSLYDKPGGVFVISVPLAAPLTVVGEKDNYYIVATYQGNLYAYKKELRPIDNKPVLAKDIITSAKEYLGVSYLWGGVSPFGFDCSGFIWAVMASFGYYLPRDAGPQYYYEKFLNVEKNKLLPGDLVFFSTYKTGPSHVGIYLGKNEFINAAGSKGVSIASLNNSYYKSRYLGARRMPFVKQ